MAEEGNICDVCGEAEFTVKEGYYYCNECGTQSHHIRDFEMDQAANDTQVFYTSQRIAKAPTAKQQLTTWECFNYLLRGLVDELLTLGAKEELKITVLQLWTTYLKKIEVAFINKKDAELPRLGPKYDERDARIIYNHEKIKAKRLRKASGKRDVSWTTRKKQYARAEYESLSASGGGSTGTTGTPGTTSGSQGSSGASNRPIRLNFSRKAREYYKRYMPASHLKKHETDGTYELDCHILHANKFRGGKPKAATIVRKTLYSLLYLGLNLIEDDIQLCDLLRYCREGHVSTSKIAHFFPDNIAKDCVDVMNRTNYFGWIQFRSAAIRAETARLANFIHIPVLKLPNIPNMAKRFVKDLDLPAEIGVYIERLYNFHPPKMRYSLGDVISPCYEGRAMAYVIFVLKLLFIVDGQGDLIISDAARSINKTLASLGLNDEQIFVWEDWVHYIEMRKLILSQCHYPSSVLFGEKLNYNQYFEHLKNEYESPLDDEKNPKRDALLTMEKIFGDLHNKLKKKKKDRKHIDPIQCAPTFTPSSSYLKYILNEKDLCESLTLPQLMHTDYAAQDIRPFINAKRLKSSLKEHNIKLIVETIGPSQKQKYVGIFRANSSIDRKKTAQNVRVRIVEHDITEEDWLKDVKRKKAPPEIFTDIGTFKLPQPVKKSAKKIVNRIAVADSNNGDNMSLHSFDVFTEENMEPLPQTAIGDGPRQFDTESIFTDLSDDEEEIDRENHESANEKSVELKTSNMHYWILSGLKRNFNNDEVRQLISKLPKIFQWLLKVCSEIVEIDVMDLYQELLVIENQFVYAIESLDDFQDVISYRQGIRVKALQESIKFYKNMW